MVKNGNFTVLLLELILADEVADLPPSILASSGQESQFYISTVRAHIGRWSGRSTGRSTPQYWHLVVKNGNFTFLLLELILADEVADLPPILASNGQEWQFHISTVRAHIGRWSGWSTGRSTFQYWHLMVKNGNFTFLLLELILADKVADVLADLWPSVQCIMGCLLWDVIDSHCGFCKKRWEFAFISE